MSGNVRQRPRRSVASNRPFSACLTFSPIITPTIVQKLMPAAVSTKPPSRPLVIIAFTASEAPRKGASCSLGHRRSSYMPPLDDAFYASMLTLSDAELFTYIHHYSRYKAEAVQAAIAELGARGLSLSLDDLLAIDRYCTRSDRPGIPRCTLEYGYRQAASAPSVA